MKQIQCVIVEDERIAREGIAGYIGQFDFLTLIGSFDNAEEGLRFIQRHPVDLLFLDIQMKGMTGLELARNLPTRQTMIIFTTAYSEYALEGYEVNSVGYLVKPVFFEDFEKAVLKVRSLFERNPGDSTTYLHIKADRESHKIRASDILFIKSMQNYIVVQLAQTSIISLQTLKSVSDKLPDSFVRVHRSYIVNLEKTDRMNASEALVGGHLIPVSQRVKNEALKRFAAYMRKNDS